MKMKMKGIDMSCVSPSSTAICSSTDQRAMVRNGTKSVQRLNSYLSDHFKTLTTNIYTHSPSSSPPCTISQLPFTPRPSSFRDKPPKLGSSAVKHTDVLSRRKSSADVSEMKRFSNKLDGYGTDAKTCSSRYLLGESKFLNSLYDDSNDNTRNSNNNYSHTTKNGNSFANSAPTTPVLGSEGRRRSCTSRVETRRFGSMLDEEKEKIGKHFSLIDVGVHQPGNGNDTPRNSKVYSRNGEETRIDGHAHVSQTHKRMERCRSDSRSQKSSPSAISPDQVVVLRVSLHCKGCEAKLRKHLSKLEGVTSFSIDLETKKVTIIGKVTPSDVLTSISKVKNAHFWPSPASASSSLSSSSRSSSSTSSIMVEYN